MRKWGYALLGLALVSFIVALLQSVTTMMTLSEAVTGGAPVPGTSARREYHVSVFLPDQETIFFEEIRAGVEIAAARHDVAVTFHPTGADAPEFSLAHYTGIDGAIIYPSRPEAQVVRQLQTLHAEEIAVVLVERDVSDEQPWTLVGTNNFELGRRIGNHLSGRGQLERIAIVYSEKSPAVASEKELVELGITTVLGDRLVTPILRRQTGLNPLAAEALTYQLLRDEPTVTTVVFTETFDTLSALQVIVDLNLVGQVRIVGFGVNPAILDYIDRGVLDATIAVNPQQIGIEAVRVLVERIATGNAPGYVDTGVELIKGGDR